MSEPFNPELEEAIAADPDDAAPRRVYADWLMEQGNPRGELAHVQLDLARSPQDRALRAREQTILSQHAAQLRGAYRDPRYPDPRQTPYLEDHCVVRWRGGFWHGLTFDGPLSVLEAVLAHPSARLLYGLHVRSLHEHGRDYAPAVQALGQSPRKALYELIIGRLPRGEEFSSFGDWSVGSLAPLARSCPRLEILRLLCPRFEMAAFESLRELDARLGATEASVRSIGSVVLPRLEALQLGFDDGRGEVIPSLVWGETALDPLLDGRATPALLALFLWLPPQRRTHPLQARVRASPLGQRLYRFEMSTWNDSDELYLDPYSM